MEIRFLNQEEHIHYMAICQTVFWDAKPRDIRAMIKGELECDRVIEDPVIALFDDSGKMLSGMIIHPFTIRMNGKEVQMAGIDGVVTKPEARTKGLVRQVFDKAFEHMRTNNQTYSFLYPFSYEYYRKLGYEYCYPYHNAKIPTKQLMSYPFPKSVTAYEPGDDIKPFAAVYETFTKNRNFAVVRDNKAWEKLLDRDPYRCLEFTFLFGPPESPTAYVLYDAKRIDGIGSLAVKELCYTSPEGLHDALGFLGRLSPEAKTVQWSVPIGIDIQSLCSDLFEVEQHTKAVGMGRIVDVQASLSGLAPPSWCHSNAGRVVVEVKDTLIASNSGLYVIEWENNQLSAKKTDSGKYVDLETSVETLMQLVCGHITINEAKYKPGTKVHSQKELLLSLFPHNPMYIMERF